MNLTEIKQEAREELKRYDSFEKLQLIKDGFLDTLIDKVVDAVEESTKIAPHNCVVGGPSTDTCRDAAGRGYARDEQIVAFRNFKQGV